MLFRELLTKLLKPIKLFSKRMEGLGRLGSFISFIVALFLYFGPYFISIWIIKVVFPDFWYYGDERSIAIVWAIIGSAMFFFFKWLLTSPPKDYVSIKISKDVYEILANINRLISKAGKLKIKVEIKETHRQGCQYFSVTFSKTLFSVADKYSDCISQIFASIEKLNGKLKELEKRNFQIKIDMIYLESEDMKAPEKSELNRYLLMANIPNRVHSAT